LAADVITAFQRRPTQRKLAVGLHAFAPRGRHRHGDHQLAGRPLALPAGHTRITGPIVVEIFGKCVNDYGMPASTLTDNDVVYTTRLLGGRNALEHVLATLNVTNKNGHPSHAQTQGKV
jgi:hypothetical protein